MDHKSRIYGINLSNEMHLSYIIEKIIVLAAIINAFERNLNTMEYKIGLV